MKLYLPFLLLSFLTIFDTKAQLLTNTEEVKLEYVKLIENGDGESYKLETEYSPIGEHIVILYRINNPNAKAGPWIIVPKPSRIPKGTFEQGNIYEFAACYKYTPDLKGSILSEPIVIDQFVDNTETEEVEVKLEYAKLVENEDGESYRLEAEYSPQGEHTIVVYRINNPDEIARFWEDIPKPGAIPKNVFKLGNIYEFAACYKYTPDLKGSILSEPIVIDQFADKTETEEVEVKLEYAKLVENEDGESFRLETEYSPQGEHTIIIYRINNPNARGGAWIIVPKPQRIPKGTFKQGNTYEFAACYKYSPDLKNSILSEPIVIDQFADNTETGELEVKLEYAKLIENEDGESFRLETKYSPQGEHTVILYRINNPNGKSAWNVVPKEGRIPKSTFEEGNIYEFAACYKYSPDLKGSILSEPIVIDQFAVNPETEEVEVKLEYAKLVENEDGESFRLETEYSPQGEHTIMVYRINNPNARVGPWIVVPKPQRIPKGTFEQGNIYEFAACYKYTPDLKGSIISKPIAIDLFANELSKGKPNFGNAVSAIAPQPANDYLNIKLDPIFKTSSIELFSTSGKKLKTFVIDNNIEKYHFDTRSLKSGLYLLKVNSSLGTSVEKIVVNR